MQVNTVDDFNLVSFVLSHTYSVIVVNFMSSNDDFFFKVIRSTKKFLVSLFFFSIFQIRHFSGS